MDPTYVRLSKQYWKLCAALEQNPRLWGSTEFQVKAGVLSFFLSQGAW